MKRPEELSMLIETSSGFLLTTCLWQKDRLNKDFPLQTNEQFLGTIIEGKICRGGILWKNTLK